jgi:hypothetical protein
MFLAARACRSGVETGLIPLYRLNRPDNLGLVHPACLQSSLSGYLFNVRKFHRISPVQLAVILDECPAGNSLFQRLDFLHGGTHSKGRGGFSPAPN